MDDYTYLRNVGDDVILRKGERLVVCSKVDMDEWELGQKRKTAIFINGEYWFIIEKQYFATGEVRYLLEPWKDAMREIPRGIIKYNEKYVRDRNEFIKAKKLESWVYPFLSLASGLIGFLPSGAKAKIEAKFGLSARNATINSIFIELLLSLGSLFPIFMLMYVSKIDAYLQFIPASGRVGSTAAFVEVTIHFIVIVLILFIDIALRYSSYLREDVNPLGAFEWVWAWIWRRFKKLP